MELASSSRALGQSKPSRPPLFLSLPSPGELVIAALLTENMEQATMKLIEAVCCLLSNLVILFPLLSCLRRKMVSVAGKTYRSHLLSVPKGPNPANANGANPFMLL